MVRLAELELLLLRAQGLCYAGLSIVFLAEGLADLAVPHLSLLAVFGYPASAASTFVWRTSGWYLATLFPSVTYSLKVRAIPMIMLDAFRLGWPAQLHSDAARL